MNSNNSKRVSDLQGRLMSELPDNNLLNNSDMMRSGSRANASTIKKKNWMQTFPFKGENALWKKG